MKSADGRPGRRRSRRPRQQHGMRAALSDFHPGPKSASSRHSPRLDRSPDRPVVRGLHVDAFRPNARCVGHIDHIDHAGRRAQAGTGRPHARRADRLCRASLRQSEPVRQDARVPVPAAQQHALTAIARHATARSQVAAYAAGVVRDTARSVAGSSPSTQDVDSRRAKKEARHSTSPGLTRDVPCGSDPLAWSGTGAARHVCDRSEATLREPDRDMKFSSRGARIAAVVRTGGATRD